MLEGETVDQYVLSYTRLREIASHHFARMWPNRYGPTARYALRQNVRQQRRCRDRIRAARDA